MNSRRYSKFSKTSRKRDDDDPLEFLVSDTAFVGKEKLNPAKNLIVGSYSGQIRDLPSTSTKKLPIERVSLLDRGRIVDLEVLHRKPAEAVVLEHAAKQASEHYDQELARPGKSEISLSLKALEEASDVWEAINRQEDISAATARLAKTIPQSDPVLPVPPSGFLADIGRSFGHSHRNMSTTPSTEQPIVSPEQEEAMEVQPSRRIHPLPPIQDSDIEIHASDSSDKSDDSTLASFMKRGLKRIDRDSTSSSSSDDNGPSHYAKSDKSKKQKKNKSDTSVIMAPPTMESAPEPNQLAKVISDQTEILGKLTDSVAKIANSHSLISDDLRELKDMFAKHTQSIQELTKAVSSLQVTSTHAIHARVEPQPSTSSVVKPALTAKEVTIREGIRAHYQGNLAKFKLQHLSEDLLTDMWSTSKSVRKSAFLARFPGIQWTEAIEHVISAKKTIREDQIKQAESELASYYLGQKNRLPTHPGMRTTELSGPGVAHGWDNPAESAQSKMDYMVATGKPIFNIKEMMKRK